MVGCAFRLTYWKKSMNFLGDAKSSSLPNSYRTRPNLNLLWFLWTFGTIFRTILKKIFSIFSEIFTKFLIPLPWKKWKNIGKMLGNHFPQGSPWFLSTKLRWLYFRQVWSFHIRVEGEAHNWACRKTVIPKQVVQKRISEFPVIIKLFPMNYIYSIQCILFQ